MLKKPDMVKVLTFSTSPGAHTISARGTDDDNFNMRLLKGKCFSILGKKRLLTIQHIHDKDFRFFIA